MTRTAPVYTVRWSSQINRTPGRSGPPTASPNAAVSSASSIHTAAAVAASSRTTTTTTTTTATTSTTMHSMLTAAFGAFTFDDAAVEQRQQQQPSPKRLSSAYFQYGHYCQRCFAGLRTVCALIAVMVGQNAAVWLVWMLVFAGDLAGR